MSADSIRRQEGGIEDLTCPVDLGRQLPGTTWRRWRSHGAVRRPLGQIPMRVGLLRNVIPQVGRRYGRGATYCLRIDAP
jgi:hypothetical protein